jgi:pyruvate formate lyase activating enzyme
MLIGGFQKFSLIDFPEHVSAIIFTQGCPMRCRYCHNPELVIPENYGPIIPAEEVLIFLKNRIGKLDGVVVTGGEPTMHTDLPDFLGQIKDLGYAIKLDTYGHSAEMLEEVISRGLVDYLAMDIKAPLENYKHVTQVGNNPLTLRKSIKLLMQSGLPYEFRTTLTKELLTRSDIFTIAKEIEGAKVYALQNFVSSKTIDPLFLNATPFSQQELLNLKSELEDTYVEQCIIR